MGSLAVIFVPVLLNHSGQSGHMPPFLSILLGLMMLALLLSMLAPMLTGAYAYFNKRPFEDGIDVGIPFSIGCLIFMGLICLILSTTLFFP